jgi:hypothetical protein
MSIILTKIINGKKVELDLISLNGKATVRSTSFDKAKAKGITKKDIEKLGIEVQK